MQLQGHFFKMLKQCFAFGFHFSGFVFRMDVIIAEDMEDTVDQQLIETPINGHSGVFGFSGASIHRYHDISQQVWIEAPMLSLLHGKGDDVGWTCVVQVRPVNLFNSRVIHNQDGEFALMAIQGV